ncbi:MAG: hypothetical protein ROZ64_13640 [Burkholderiaceae bacterium]|jgi:hypothetical protein|nr:hypothetical protein [Burkholderiaceae bacterium]
MSKRFIPLSKIPDACRAAQLPEEVVPHIALDSRATASPAALERAVSDAAEILALARLSGFVFDEYGSPDKQASERAAVALIRERVSLDEARNRICHALVVEDERVGHVNTARPSDSAPFSPWAARAAEGAPK